MILFQLSMHLLSTPPENLMKGLLLPHFKRLCRDPEPRVRLHVAAVFHEFAQYLKHDSALIIDSFVDLCYCAEPEVIGCLAVHLEKILECVYGKKKNGVADGAVGGNGFSQVQYSECTVAGLLLHKVA
jgi:hypothetical protein